MGWRGRGGGRGWAGPWPGRGPFSYLPPWQRPGWLYGRGACWWLFAPYLQSIAPQTPPAVVPPTPVPPTIPMPSAPSTFTKEQETLMLQQQMKVLESQLDAIRKRLQELSK